MRLPFAISLLLAQLSAFSTSASAQTVTCVAAGVGGAIPAAGTGGAVYPFGPLPTSPTQLPITVNSLPPGANFVTELKLLGLVHTWVSDLQVVLTDPSGVTHNMFCRMSASNGASFGCDYNGDYTILPECTAVVLPPPAFCSSPGIFQPGAYDQLFGRGGNAWPNGVSGIFNTRMDAIPASIGVWTVTFYDWSPGDSGSVTDVQLCFGTPPATTAPPSAAPTLTSPGLSVSVFGPNVRLVWSAAACATNYEVEVDGVVQSTSLTSLNYASSPGPHSWRVRALNPQGAGPWSSARTFTDLGPAPAVCDGPSLATLFAWNTTQSASGAVFFDVEVLTPGGIRLSEIELNTTAAAPTALSLSVYTRSGTHIGAEQSSSGWTLATSGVGLSQAQNGASLIDIADLPLPQGVTGFCLALSGGSQAVTLFNPVVNPTYSNADLRLTAGSVQPILFASAPVAGRVWNGRLRYNCGLPVAYCTAGTSTNGCAAVMSASAQPSASQTTACVISANGVEGQKLGLIFYGVDNSGFTPFTWGSGSSFLCIKAPTQRTGAANSGGTLAQCDGSFSLNWNSFLSANPGALGAPFGVGSKLYAQAWYRDPPASKSTNLSNGLDVTFGP